MTTTTRPAGASGRHEVQARRIRRRGQVVIGDDTQRATTTILADAQRTARALAADGYAVWVYLVRDGDGFHPIYDTVETLAPATAAPTGRSGPAGPARGAAWTPPTTGRGGTATAPPPRPGTTAPAARRVRRT